MLLEFEKNIANLEKKLSEIKSSSSDETDEISLEQELEAIGEKVQSSLHSLYSSLTPWQKTLVARHPLRPHGKSYIDNLIADFHEISGDRRFSEDYAIIAGFGYFHGSPVAILAQEKGNSTETRLKHNFGMANPEGYRKAIRLMELADKFSCPVISFIDTSGAYPGIGAEERGQAEAIASSIKMCLEMTVPNISIIIGEGGSGGAIAVGATNTILMLEHAIYSVASPEASASILWRTSSRAADAANSMGITSAFLYKNNLVDEIIQEPIGGAHRNHKEIFQNTDEALAKNLEQLNQLSPDEIINQREQKFLSIGLL